MVLHVDSDGFGFLISDLSRLIRADMDRQIELSGVGITPGEARTLICIARYGEKRQSFLAERMGLEAMTLSSYLDRLERNGFVQRIPDPSDGRAKLVQLTASAQVALETIQQIGQKARLRARGAMNDEEWERFHNQLKKIRERFSGV